MLQKCRAICSLGVPSIGILSPSHKLMESITLYRRLFFGLLFQLCQLRFDGLFFLFLLLLTSDRLNSLTDLSSNASVLDVLVTGRLFGPTIVTADYFSNRVLNQLGQITKLDTGRFLRWLITHGFLP